LETGKQYLVTNIRFTDGQFSQDINTGKNVVDEFKVPASTDLINAWLHEFDYESFSDKSAYALFIREVLFNNYNVKYDFQLIKELPMSNAWVIDELHIIDVFDQKYPDYTKAAVEITVPNAYIANLSADDLLFADNDVEQAIYENMLNQLHLDINVLSVTDQILQLMSDLMAEINAPDPDSIAQAVADMMPIEMTSQKLQEIYDSVHMLASVLVKDIGKYM
jgi:hypothetical protein